MDVHCSTCNEPWDTYHLWHDAIAEIGLPEADVTAWRRLPSSERLSGLYRNAFKACGSEFGRTVINVTRCPACPEGSLPNPDRVQTKAALEELMGDDEDGLAATFEDYRL